MWLKRDRTSPFCAWISFPDPHHPFDCPEPWSRLHGPADVDLPVHRRRTFEGRPWWHEQVLTAEPVGPKKNAELRKRYSRIEEQTDEQLREIIANTYGRIALIDHNDPLETCNLFDAPEAAGVRRGLEALPARRPDDAGPIRTPVGIA